MKKYFKKIIILISLTAILALPYIVLAESQSTVNLKQVGEKGDTPPWSGATDTSLAGIVSIVIQAFLGLLGVLFLTYLLYAGYHWMTAQGDEKKVDKAKDTLTRAVIGLIIIIAAYSITYFVFTSLPGGDTVGTTGTTGVNETPR